MELLYLLADAMYEFMQADPGLVRMLLCGLIVGIPLTVLHEMGHAVAAAVLLDDDVDVEVGSSGKLADVQLGRIRMSLNALAPLGGVAGSATFSEARASARDVLLIALAGPAASLAGLLVCAWAYSAVGQESLLHPLLWTATFGSVFGVLNLVPFVLRERDGSANRSDGYLALDALRVMRALR